MKKRLILMLNDYPYESGEYPFLKTELKHLTDAFDVSIFCKSMEGEHEHDPKMTLPDGARLYDNRIRFGFKEKLVSLFGFIFSKAGREEIRDILREKKDIKGRLYISLSYYGCAYYSAKNARKTFLKDGNEDFIVYSYWFDFFCLGLLLEKKYYPNMKVISRIHGVDLYNERRPYNRQPFRKYMDRNIDSLFFIARSGMEYYAKAFSADTGSGTYFYAPLGTERPETVNGSAADGNCFEIVSCSGCIPLKRVNLIIEALSLTEDSDLQRKPIKWVHFGDGELFEELKDLADNILSGRNNLTYEFKGNVPVEDVLDHYRDSKPDAFITTSETEGCPVSIQEALSYGIPVIGTAVGEIPDMISDCGYVIDKDTDPPRIKEAMIKLYNDSFDMDKISVMRKNAFNKWQQDYDAELNSERFITLIKDL